MTFKIQNSIAVKGENSYQEPVAVAVILQILPLSEGKFHYLRGFKTTLTHFKPTWSILTEYRAKNR